MVAHVLAHFWPKAIVVSISDLACSFSSPYEVTYHDYLFSLVLWQISEAINSSNLTSRYIFTGTLRVLKNLSIPQPVINSSTPYLSFEYILVGYLCLRVLGEGCRWVSGTKMNPSFTDKEQLPKPPWPRKLSIPIPQFSYFRIIALSFQVINIFVNMTHTYWFWPQRGC